MQGARLGSIADLGTGERFDGDRLARLIDSRADAFAGQGVGRGERVAVLHGNSIAFFIDLLAIWRRGAAVACLDPGMSPPEFRTVLGFLKPALALRDGASPEVMGAHEMRRGPDNAPLDDPALILFTSGTTAEPKGVVLTRRALMARLALNAKEIGAAALARTLLTLPTHFGHGLIGNALTAWLSGGDLILHPRGLPLARALGEIVDAERVTFMSSVPSFWHLALKLSRRPAGGTLRRIHVGSAPLSRPLWRGVADWSGAQVFNCYGITETANWIAGLPLEQATRDGDVGAPWGGRAAVRDADGRILASGEGEILIDSPAIMSGYLDRPDLTAEAMRGGWYRTGDFGSVDEDGRITLLGRLKDEINRGGFKVQPAEIDMLLERHDAVAEACAFAIPDAVSGEIVGVAVRLREGADVTAEALRAWCGERMRREAIPERWHVVAEIPRTGRGKVRRDDVRRAVEAT